MSFASDGSFVMLNSPSLDRSAFAERSLSIALLRAVVVSHAAGRSGMPSFGHRSNAVAKASCVPSSASVQSPVRRINPATIRPQSDR